MIDAFPEEIRHGILFRLPIKCLIRCTSVSKPWLSIVKNSGFIRAHLSRQQEALLLLHGSRHHRSRREAADEATDDDDDEATDDVYCLHHDNPSFDEYREVDFLIDYTVDPINQRFRVAGTCDGLVCLADDILSKALSYVIWNPSIRKAVTLPRPGYTFTTHGPFEDSIGFGFDAMANDYKVARLVSLRKLEDEDVESPTVAEVYSLATGSWRILGHVLPSCQILGTRPYAFLNSNIHWVVSHWKDVGYFILAFDLVGESFCEILVPKRAELGFNSQLSVTGDGKNLALFTNVKNDSGHLDIWVMKEYCQHESWTKMITLSGQSPEGSLSPIILCFRKSGEVLLCFRKSGEVLFAVRGSYFSETHTFVSLDLVSQRMNNVDTLDCVCYSLDSYKESLVLLDVDNAVSC